MAQDRPQIIMNNVHNAEALPIFDGEPADFYCFINAAEQYIAMRDNSHLTISHIIARLRGKAARIVHSNIHNFNWQSIKDLLKTECSDNKTIDLLQIELTNMKKHNNTYTEFIKKIKEILFQIKIKIIEKYGNNNLGNLLSIYEITARTTLINQLPNEIKCQFIMSDDNFEKICEKVKTLETYDAIKNINYNKQNNFNNYHKHNHSFNRPNNNNFNNFNRSNNQFNSNFNNNNLNNSNRIKQFNYNMRNAQVPHWVQHNRSNQQRFNQMKQQQSFRPQWNVPQINHDVSMRSVNRNNNNNNYRDTHNKNQQPTIQAEELFNQSTDPNFHIEKESIHPT